MRRRHQILIHHSLRPGLERLGRERSGFRQLFAEAMRALSLEPARSPFRRMGGIQDPHWRRSIRRVWIGGRQGYRMIYLLVEEHRRVLPVYLSPVTRAEGFDYSPKLWHEAYHAIFGHYQADTHEFGRDAGRYRHFAPWPVDG